jgi:hypothetical protein
MPPLSVGNDSKATSRRSLTLSADGQFLKWIVPLNPEGSFNGARPVSHPKQKSRSVVRYVIVRRVRFIGILAGKSHRPTK